MANTIHGCATLALPQQSLRRGGALQMDQPSNTSRPIPATHRLTHPLCHAPTHASPG